MAATGNDNEPQELAVRAAESILGPNPIVGLSPADMLGAAQALLLQMLKQPGVVAQSYVALIGELAR
ncbi:MAG: class II poly(R)-hydroxyalkanoic acid synthase, partial [Burkholderiales bacterium]